MIILTLAILGLAFGSFVNALVWRLHKISTAKVGKDTKKYSILTGRSMCINCKHELSAMDLIPVFSWLSLGGKCRYCKKYISVQYPIVELTTAFTFVISYIYWPYALSGYEVGVFIFWLMALVGFMALVVYDLRWTLLPNRIVLYLYIVSAGYALMKILGSADRAEALQDTVIAVLIGGGIFYLLFQISRGNWIGGGDVKLGFALGALVGEPQQAFMMLFIASILGTLVSIPLMILNKASKKTRIPFGPFLITATIIVVLFGATINDWYVDLILSGIY